jgi:hypothetical protein
VSQPPAVGSRQYIVHGREMALAVLGLDLAIHLGAPLIQMLLCAPSFSFHFVLIPRTYESSKEFVVPRHPRPTYQPTAILRHPNPPRLPVRCTRLHRRSAAPGSFLAPAAHGPAVPPTQRRLQALALPNTTVLWVSWAGIHADFRPHCKSPGSPGVHVATSPWTRLLRSTEEARRSYRGEVRGVGMLSCFFVPGPSAGVRLL